MKTCETCEGRCVVADPRSSYVAADGSVDTYDDMECPTCKGVGSDLNTCDSDECEDEIWRGGDDHTYCLTHEKDYREGLIKDFPPLCSEDDCDEQRSSYCANHEPIPFGILYATQRLLTASESVEGRTMEMGVALFLKNEIDAFVKVVRAQEEKRARRASGPVLGK